MIDWDTRSGPHSYEVEVLERKTVKMWGCRLNSTLVLTARERPHKCETDRKGKRISMLSAKLRFRRDSPNKKYWCGLKLNVIETRATSETLICFVVHIL